MFIASGEVFQKESPDGYRPPGRWHGPRRSTSRHVGLSREVRAENHCVLVKRPINPSVSCRCRLATIVPTTQVFLTRVAVHRSILKSSHEGHERCAAFPMTQTF